MLADVGQRFLRHPVQGEPGRGIEVPLLAGDRERAGDAAVAFESGGKRGQPFRPWQLVVAEHADRAARLLQSVAGEVVGPVDGYREPRVGWVLRGQQPGPLQLHDETGQRMRQHVVHFPG